jgi:hypothetical protein
MDIEYCVCKKILSSVIQFSRCDIPIHASAVHNIFWQKNWGAESGEHSQHSLGCDTI